MVGIGRQHPPETELGGVIVLAVLVEQPEVQQGAKKLRRSRERLFVEPDGLFVVAMTGVFQGEIEQRPAVVRVHVDRPLERLDRRRGVALFGQDTAHLVGVLGTGGGTRGCVLQGLFGIGKPTITANCANASQRTLDLVVTSPGSLLKPLTGSRIVAK